MKHYIFILILIISSFTALAKPPRLAVESLFDGRYNKNKSVTTSISKSDGIYYRSLHVTDNPDIIEKIEKAIHQDSSKASNLFEQEGEGGRSTLVKIINNGETINIGLQQYNGSAFFFIKGSEKAFK